MARNQRTSFRGTIWQDALQRAHFIHDSGIDETVICPVLSCRNPNKTFTKPSDLRYHAHKYHKETINYKNSDQPIQQTEEDYDFMEVDQNDSPQVQLLNPAPRPNLQESFIIIKHENDPNFQVNTFIIKCSDQCEHLCTNVQQCPQMCGH